jgi:hypothetical protein
MSPVTERPDDLAGQINYELNQEGVAGQLRRIDSDRYRRFATRQRPTVLMWDTARRTEEDVYYLKPPPGSVQLFWGKRESNLFAEVREAYQRQDVGALRALSERVVNEVASKPIVSVEQAVTELLDLPVYFDLRYGKRTLAAALALPEGVELANLLFAYNGGKLTTADFEVVNYETSPRAARPARRLPIRLWSSANEAPRPDGYDLFVVVAPPLLSAAESRAINLVPNEYRDVHLGPTINSASWVTVVHFVRVVVAITMTGNTSKFHTDLRTLPALPDHELDTLGPVPSAEKLLQMRRAIFEKYHR